MEKKFDNAKSVNSKFNMNQDNPLQSTQTKLQQELGIKNPLAVPKLSKIVLNIGVREVLADKKYLDKAAEALSLLSGQKARVNKAKQSIAGFKLREGQEIGLTVTLRGKRMYDFMNKLVNIVLPRLRDFHGVPRKSFDGHGNYTLGFSEHTVFPEIDPAKFDRIQGLEMTVVTTAKDDKQGIALLTALGMQFEKVR